MDDRIARQKVKPTHLDRPLVAVYSKAHKPRRLPTTNPCCASGRVDSQGH